MTQIIQIILESISSLLKGIDIFLQSKDLTLGAILALIAPFIVLWMKVSNEKGKKAKQLLIERRQMQIAFNVNEIMEHLKVESKWSLQEIGSTHTDLKSSKKWLKSYLKRKGRIHMNLSGKKKILAVGAAILINGCNDVFGLNLTPETIATVSALGGGYVLIEAILDIVRAWSNKSVVNVQSLGTATQSLNGGSNVILTTDTSPDK